MSCSPISPSQFAPPNTMTGGSAVSLSLSATAKHARRSGETCSSDPPPWAGAAKMRTTHSIKNSSRNARLREFRRQRISGSAETRQNLGNIIVLMWDAVPKKPGPQKTISPKRMSDGKTVRHALCKRAAPSAAPPGCRLRYSMQELKPARAISRLQQAHPDGGPADICERKNSENTTSIWRITMTLARSFSEV